MKVKSDGLNFVIRLEKGDKVKESLLRLVKEKNIKGGFITGLGGLSWAEVGFFDLTAKAYAWTRFDEPLELLNVTGNIAWMKNEPYLHLHATISDASQYARGGHLNEAETLATVEVFIHVLDKETKLERKSDKMTGLNLLDL